MPFRFTTLARLLLHWGAVRGRGLVIGVLLLGQAACLIPQDDPVLDPLPPTRNRPPRILENLVNPPRTFPAQTIFTGPNCPPNVEFQVFVADPDVDDALTVRWFIDYDPVNNTGTIGLDSRIPPSGREVRDLTGDLLLSTSLAPISAGGLHLIEAFVFDGALFNREPLPLEVAPDGTVINPSYVDTFAWYINFENQACP